VLFFLVINFLSKNTHLEANRSKTHSNFSLTTTASTPGPLSASTPSADFSLGNVCTALADDGAITRGGPYFSAIRRRRTRVRPGRWLRSVPGKKLGQQVIAATCF
jgi:hypothetical protein